MQKFLLMPLFFLTGCAQWLPANYSELESGTYALSATGNSFASVEQLQEKIDKKAAQLCANGYNFVEPAEITNHTQDTYMNGTTYSGSYFVLHRVAKCRD
jgi:hypothetical protein